MVNSKTGDLVRIGPNEVLTSDISVLQRLSALKSPYTRGPWYDTFQFVKGQRNLFSTTNEKAHTVLRNKLGPGYAGSDIMESGVDLTISRLLQLIDRKYLCTDTQYRPMDFAFIAHLFAIDVIGEVTFGKPFGFLDEGVDNFGFLKWNEANMPIFMTVATLPWLAKIVHFSWFPDVLPKETDTVGLGRFIG